MNKFYRAKLFLVAASILLGCQATWATAVLDFDGDGKTDPTVQGYPNTGQGYYQITWFSLHSSGDGFSAIPWGQSKSGSQDWNVPADYDGDGKCDVAIWRRSTTGEAQSYFIIYYSGSGTVGYIPLGGWQDQPMPQDYDGDGKADPAVYRPSDSTWYIQQSRDGFRAERWPVFTPIPGDYDGDGKADLAGYRRATTSPYALTFYIQPSSGAPWIVEQYGYQLADFVVPGDYDGDGKTDIAVWRGADQYGNGTWYWHRSSDGKYDQLNWGYTLAGEDYPVQGDYDGDGTTDIAVYRRNLSGPSNFFINESKDGFTVIQWGDGRYHQSIGRLY